MSRAPSNGRAREKTPTRRRLATCSTPWTSCAGADRERRARKDAESYLESKSLELYYANQQLIHARDDLETRVAKRTEELSEANRRLQAQMADRQELNRRMLELSHQAGKAEVATEVLHNVGNVLNSVNVSARVVDIVLNGQNGDSLRRLSQMLDEQQDLAEFFQRDPRAALLPRYLQTLAEKNTKEIDKARKELRSVMVHLEHIMAIVATQQSNARISGLNEVVSLPDLLDEAALLFSKSLSKHRIELARDYQESTPVMIERQKLMQVLLNLIKNAKEAVNESDSQQRRITLHVVRDSLKTVAITVSDSGRGIAAENLTKIFHHGYTTRKKGHGFGLHSCANAAGEMGGELRVASEGVGRGASFTLRLPFRPADPNHETATPPAAPSE